MAVLILLIIGGLFGMIMFIAHIVDNDHTSVSDYKNPKFSSAVQQLSKDVGMLPINGFNCPKCGAVVKIDPNHPAAFCQFCGAPFPKSEELFKLSYEYMEKNKQRQMEEKRMRHEERIESAKNFKERAQFIMIMSVIGLGVLYFIFIFILTRH